MWSVVLVLLSYLDRNFAKGHFLGLPLDAGRGSKEVFYMLNSTFCARSSSAGRNYIWQVSDGTEEVRSVHDPAGNLLDCSVTSNPMEVKSFMHVCRLELKDQRGRRAAPEQSRASVAEAKSHCRAFQRRAKRTRRSAAPATPATPTAPVPESRRDTEGPEGPEAGRVPRRSKRGFTYPGTLWCGAGNIADSYDHLGEFAETDSCCRIHDHCPYVIHAFSHNFGYTNFKWHSISHCDCDNALKDCLRKVNDTSSRVVGQAFFNVIEVPCFDFTYEEQCVERHWYGMCKRYDNVPVAVMKESTPYDFGGIDVIDKLTIAPRVLKVKEDGERLETTTRAPASSPQSTTHDEPSIGRVVTAAEDFIKVLATVSTSHSSTTEAAKEEVPGTNKKNRKKKKKKKMGKKKKGSKKKGKGRKRKQRVNTLSKVEEATSMTPVGPKVKDVIDNSLANNPTYDGHKVEQNLNTFDNNLAGVQDTGELSNELMKDEPQRQSDNTVISAVTSAAAVLVEPEELEFHKLQHPRGKGHLSLTGSATKVNVLQLNRQKSAETQGAETKQKTTPEPTTPSSALRNALESKQTITGVSTHTITTSPSTDIYVQQFESQRLEKHTEKIILTTTPSMSVLSPLKTRRQKLKQKLGRKSWRKLTHFFSPSLSTPNCSPSTTATDKTRKNMRYNTGTTPSAVFNGDTDWGFGPQKLQSHKEKGLLTTTANTPSVNFLKNKMHKLKDKQGEKNRRVPLSMPNITSPNGTKIQTSTSYISGTNTSPSSNIRSGGTVELQSSESNTEQDFVTTMSTVPTFNVTEVKQRKGRRGRRRRRKITPTFSTVVPSG